VTAVLLLILAAIWAAVLVPPAIQNRRASRPGDSIATFRNQLNVLERTTPAFRAGVGSRPVAPAAARAMRRPGQSAAAYRRAEARRRRRDVFVTLLAAVGVTFVGALLMGGVAWTIHVVVDVLFAGYVGMLLKIQQQAAEREAKVRYLPERRPAQVVEPAVLRRSATN
jgi:hypothetical protein